MNTKELQRIAAWARSICHQTFGPEEGERVFRALPAMRVLEAWSSKTLIFA